MLKKTKRIRLISICKCYLKLPLHYCTVQIVRYCVIVTIIYFHFVFVVLARCTRRALCPSPWEGTSRKRGQITTNHAWNLCGSCGLLANTWKPVASICEFIIYRYVYTMGTLHHIMHIILQGDPVMSHHIRSHFTIPGVYRQQNGVCPAK